MNNRLLLTCLTLCLSHTVFSAPLETSTVKSGAEEAHPATPKSVNLEDKVKEAVQKAELDASLAAQDAVKHGHKAESRVERIRGSAEPSHESNDETADDKPNQTSRKHATLVSDIDEGPHIKRVKEHKVNRKPGGIGKMMGLGELGDLGGNNNDYKEDTRLEDRLAMEAEEEKKYETGEGYGGGGGGGGAGAGWEDGGKGVNWATNIQRQDAAEKQSIQAQVASESAHELDEIQRAIAAESQSSRGSASIGNGGASVVGGAPAGAQQEGIQPRISSPQEEGRGGQPVAFGGGQQRENQDEFQEYASPYTSQQSSFVQPEISILIHQADKMLPNEMRGSSQQSNMELGSLGARGTQSLNGGMGGFGGLEGAQQLGGQGQAAPVEQAPMGGSERTGFGGAMDAGAMGQEAMGQGAMGGGGRLSESAVSRMSEGSLGGGGSLQGMQGVQSVQGMEGMQSMTSAFTGGQQVQGGMLSDGGGVNALQGQGMMDGSLQSNSLQGGALQGGLQSMMGGGLAGLPAMGGGGEFGQQQMAFKKSTIARPSDFQRSKTHQKEESKRKLKKTSQEYKDATAEGSTPAKHLLEDRKTVPSKMTKRQHSKHSKTQ
ncbi:uncharacterized PE-PGRS family protein PE_PGRS46-like isoform X2 [Orbicella faveolata]|uniref:uncharacterized PE-PGRS family protein PE_PGRS46-like isoform X2 n=1 Tax=Orbicella faveolata TaxID=48498 RepID=UPI0009E2C16D|nr:uncharacterized PE-PGRS family protein PE_PGRS46-like isoform X2 [Orbicella faveolata]